MNTLYYFITAIRLQTSQKKKLCRACTIAEDNTLRSVFKGNISALPGAILRTLFCIAEGDGFV